ncbi:protein US34 [Human betaherpesvirus 5]|uniref:Protein US34 n=1 Tax=Human cytomegalovirus TaxID=10359 RepID=A0A0G2UAD2_HCMV|nr:protein US34 [Human betaherpesvirus 5]WNA12860.1 protein US34 [Cytomegalovirus humanbeta5]AHJ84402.1 protein US34 [Human betaherpesvirus 5]AKI14405.1 protein US34 [Human betaherpesvirus 5]AKI17914.1 protein US34 [Human betaherpesvirus 5]
MNLEQLINVLGLLVWIAARAVSRVGPHGSGLVYRELHDFYGYLQLDLLGPVVAGNRSVRTWREQADRARGTFARRSGLNTSRILPVGSMYRGSDALSAGLYRPEEEVFLLLNRCHGPLSTPKNACLAEVGVANATFLSRFNVGDFHGASWENGTAPDGEPGVC